MKMCGNVRLVYIQTRLKSKVLKEEENTDQAAQISARSANTQVLTLRLTLPVPKLQHEAGLVDMELTGALDLTAATDAAQAGHQNVEEPKHKRRSGNAVGTSTPTAMLRGSQESFDLSRLSLTLCEGFTLFRFDAVGLKWD